MSISSVPQTLWHLYVDNLVHYKHGSWVAKIASTCRILAFATIVPFVLLILLDVASYIIARTLGVIDETKASTSSESEPLKDQPTIVVNDMDTSSDSVTALATSTPLPPDDGDDGNLKLSGVDTFSPAPSQPGSPTLQRREFMQHQHAHYGSGSSLYGRLHEGEDGVRAEENLDLRNGGNGHDEDDGDEGDTDGGSGAETPRDTAGSSSGDSSYAFLDRDSGSEDAGVVLRRRTRTAPDAGDGAA